MLGIKDISDRLKRSMLSDPGARGDFIGYCCCLVALLASPYVLFQAIDENNWTVTVLIGGFLGVTLALLSFFDQKPIPRLLAWYAPVAYCLFCLYELLQGGEQGTGFLWSCIAPPLVLATLGIRTGSLTLTVFLFCELSLLYAGELLGSWAYNYDNTLAINLAIILILMGVVTAIIEFSADYAFRHNQELTNKLRQQALKDELTGLANRRAMRQTLFKEIARSQRTKRPLSLLMVDIDYFKKINDTYGHDIGDQALRWLAQVFESTLRVTDVASRWGGEEFLILLPETDFQQAYYVADRIREAVEDQNLPDCPQEVHFTVSCGIANSHFKDGDPYTDIDVLTNMADENLYLAKHNGRNRVEPQIQYTHTD